MRLLDQDAHAVAREIESRHVGGEELRRTAGKRRAQQRAAPRTARAARLVIEGCAVGRERPAVDSFVEAVRLAARRPPGDAPQLELLVAPLRGPGDVQQAAAANRGTLHPPRGLPGGTAPGQ